MDVEQLSEDERIFYTVVVPAVRHAARHATGPIRDQLEKALQEGDVAFRGETKLCWVIIDGHDVCGIPWHVLLGTPPPEAGQG